MLFIGVLSLTVLTGASGQISLGQGALMAVGGYSSASMITNLGAPIWVAFLAAIFAAGIFGLILGAAAARVSGPYLAGTTLVIALALPSVANRFESVLGGDVGLIVDFGTPPTWISNLIEVGYEQWQLWVSLPVALIALFFISNLMAARAGRSWQAVRDDEIGAAVSGIPVARTKVIVFVVRLCDRRSWWCALWITRLSRTERLPSFTFLDFVNRSNTWWSRKHCWCIYWHFNCGFSPRSN